MVSLCTKITEVNLSENADKFNFPNLCDRDLYIIFCLLLCTLNIYMWHMRTA